MEPDGQVDSAGDPLSPTLDGNSGDDSDKEDSADDPAEGNQGFVGSSLLTEDALRRMWKKCGFSQEIEAQVLLEKERPWSAPPGWVCLYSLYFLQSRLWFPLPRLLTSYAVKRDVAISQMSPADIRNMVIALVLGAEVDVDVDVEFFKMISQMNFITDETFSVSIKARCRLMDGRGPSKVDGWQRKYFFIHISPASVLNSSAVFRTEWNPQPGNFLLIFWLFLFLTSILLICCCCLFSGTREALASSIMGEQSFTTGSWLWEDFLG